MSILTEPVDLDAGGPTRTGRRAYSCAARWERLLHGADALRMHCGAFRRERAIDWSRVEQFIFVCSRNDWRSPYAARRARAASLRAFSCGVRLEPDGAVDPVAVMVARRRGLDLVHHVPRDIRQVRVHVGDILVALAPAQLPPLRRLAQRAGAQVTLLGLWSVPVRPRLAGARAPSEEGCNGCFMLIDSGIARLAGMLAEARGTARASEE